MLDNDVVLNTNEWIDVLINGHDILGITGLQHRLDTAYPDKGIVVQFSFDGFTLPRESNYGRELANPFVAISMRFRLDDNMYWKSKLPKLEGHIGWPENLDIRLDIWARTPPETRDISDSVCDFLRLMQIELWDKARAELTMTWEAENYVDKLEGVPDLWHRNINIILKVFKTKEVD